MLPVVIINGPLGSGKTTLIHSLLKTHIKAKRTLWLKTEFGEESIDEYVLIDTGVQTTSLTGGCICHVLLSELDGILTKIEAMQDVDQVIIETSGMSHPAPVVQAIERHPQFRVSQAVLVVDVVHAHKDNYPKPMILPDGVSAPYDMIVLNKYNMSMNASEEGKIEKVLDPWFAGVYNSVAKIRIPDHQFEDDYAKMIEQWAQDIENDMRNAACQSPRHVSEESIEPLDEEKAEDHEGDMEVLTFHMPADDIVSRESVEQYAQSAPEDVIRIKGIFHTDQDTWEFFNWARGEGSWSSIHTTPGGQVLLVIGHGIKRNTALEFSPTE